MLSRVLTDNRLSRIHTGDNRFYRVLTYDNRLSRVLANNSFFIHLINKQTIRQFISIQFSVVIAVGKLYLNISSYIRSHNLSNIKLTLSMIQNKLTQYMVHLICTTQSMIHLQKYSFNDL